MAAEIFTEQPLGREVELMFRPCNRTPTKFQRQTSSRLKWRIAWGPAASHVGQRKGRQRSQDVENRTLFIPLQNAQHIPAYQPSSRVV